MTANDYMPVAALCLGTLATVLWLCWRSES